MVDIYVQYVGEKVLSTKVDSLKESDKPKITLMKAVWIDTKKSTCLRA